MKKKKFNLSGVAAAVIAILVLVVFVPVNIIFNYYDKVFDMTPSGRYTLNKKTVQLLDETSDKQIEIYYLSLLKYFQDAPEYLSLYHTLTQLDERDNITLTCFEPDENPALAKQLDPDDILGISAGDIFVKCGDVIKKIDHNKIFQKSDGVLEYAGEELIVAAIETCTSGSLPTVYFLTGHGEKSIDDSYSVYANQLKTNNYDVKELDLTKADSIPDNAKIIYLAGPQEDITDNELTLLNDYLSSGGALSMLIAPCDTEGRFTNIESILTDFGIIMDYNVVTETNASNQLRDRDDMQSDSFFRVEYPEATEDYSENLTSDINYLIEKGEYSAGITNSRSFSEIPETSFANADFVEVGPLVRNIQNSDGTYTTVSMPMGGDDITEAEASDKLSGIQLDFGYYSYNKSNGAKLVVMGSTDIIDIDAIAPSVNGTQMLLTFSNTWLYDSDISAGIGSKLNSYDSMHFDNAASAQTAMIAIILIPIALIVVGILVWLKRRHA